MTTNDTLELDWIVCVDWGVGLAKRRAWVSTLEDRSVCELHGGPWTVARLFEAARHLKGRGILSIDAVLGIPNDYLRRWRDSSPTRHSVAGFTSWLSCAHATPGFYTSAPNAGAWSVDRPFIAVPGGEGALSAFWQVTGGRLLRQIEKQTGAKSAFIVSGIPGTVGSGTRALWSELAPLLAQRRDGNDFGIWPFEGRLPKLLARHKIVLGEIYPRVCYALGLDAVLPAPLRILAKTDAATRSTATLCLLSSEWVRRENVQIRVADPATIDEDNFDAMISAAGLLRCVLEGRALERAGTDGVEGDILALAALTFGQAGSSGQPLGFGGAMDRPTSAPRTPRQGDSSLSAELPRFPCPIPGCVKVFSGTRGGWDAHVGAIRKHPRWHPELGASEARKNAFRTEFPRW